MLSIERSSGENLWFGVDTSRDKLDAPFQHQIISVGTNSGKVVNGYESYLATGEKSILPVIHREEVSNKIIDQKDEIATDYNFSLIRSKDSEKASTDKTLLLDFIRTHFGFENFEKLSDKVNTIREQVTIKTLDQFCALIKNGAFFKHWADYYAEQAKKMASSLNLAA